MENKIDYDFDTYKCYDIYSCEDKLIKSFKQDSLLPQGYFSTKKRALKYASILYHRTDRNYSIEILDTMF